VSRFDSTLDVLRRGVDAPLLAFSGGKDSLVVADLTVRALGTVPPSFFMELVPGLELTDIILSVGKKLWGIEPLRVPHWSVSMYLQQGVYCPGDPYSPTLKLADIHAYVSKETGAKTVITGAKKSDGMWRRTWLSTTGRFGMVHPIVDWSRQDVIAYLKLRGIPMPPTLGPTGVTCSGIDLTPPFLLWCHAHYPADFARIAEVFPYVEAVVWREKFYPSAGNTYSGRVVSGGVVSGGARAGSAPILPDAPHPA
jgi:phosphoadenosine phosphosulfate reductase